MEFLAGSPVLPVFSGSVHNVSLRFGIYYSEVKILSQCGFVKDLFSLAANQPVHTPI